MFNRRHGARQICVPTTGSAQYLLPLVGLFTAILFWQIICDLGVAPTNYLPSPTMVGESFVKMWYDAPEQVVIPGTTELRDVQPGLDTVMNSTIVKDSWASFYRITVSVFLACLIGIPIGILMGAFGKFESFFLLLVEPARNSPIIGFIGVFLLIWGLDESMKVYFLFFGTVVFIIPMTRDAIRNVPRDLIDNAVDLNFRPWQTLWYYVIPAALPRIWDSIKVCTGIAWTYLVAAEMINVTDGLGAVVANAQSLGNEPGRVYAGILLMIFFGVVTDAFFRVTAKHVPVLKEAK